MDNKKGGKTMAKKHNLPVLLSVLITAVVAGGSVYLWQHLAQTEKAPPGDIEAQLEELEAEADLLREQNELLQEETAALEEERDSLQRQLEEAKEAAAVEIRRQPKEGWEQYFPDPEETTLKGESIENVRELLGEPPFKIRSIAENEAHNHEIWIFQPFEEDTSGLYLFFKGNKLWRSMIDEFNGLFGSQLLEDEEFWME
jgi:TolA-binding protein